MLVVAIPGSRSRARAGGRARARADDGVPNARASELLDQRRGERGVAVGRVHGENLPVVDPVTIERRLVDLDAEPRPLREVEEAVPELAFARGDVIRRRGAGWPGRGRCPGSVPLVRMIWTPWRGGRDSHRPVERAREVGGEHGTDRGARCRSRRPWTASPWRTRTRGAAPLGGRRPRRSRLRQPPAGLRHPGPREPSRATRSPVAPPARCRAPRGHPAPGSPRRPPTPRSHRRGSGRPARGLAAQQRRPPRHRRRRASA